jgi:predicted Zn-dependent protease
MKDVLRSALLNLDVDYADIRFDEERKTQLTLNGEYVEQIATFGPRGGHVRVYVDGGKAIASFSRIEDAREVARQTAVAARIAAKHCKQPIELADAPVIQRDFPIVSANDPRNISLAEKHDVLAHYSGMAAKVPEVLMTQFMYGDSFSHRTFVNTEGTAVSYDHLIAHILGILVGRRGDAVRKAYFAIGGADDFGRLLHRDDLLKQAIEELDELLGAPSVKAGNYPIVLDTIGAGVFIHEAFGHPSEADISQHDPMLRERLALGTQIGAPILNVIDNPTIPDRGGSYSVDDEGVLARKTQLITDGRVSGRLHSRESAAAFGESITGNCRASDAGFGPLIRMSNTIIESGEDTLDDMIASIDDGFYVAGGAGGQGGIDFTFGARWARRIRKGKLGEMVSDANLSGNLFSTLKAISMVGNDLSLGEYGDCGKGSFDGVQMITRISSGSPHIKIDSVTVGGVS